MGNIFASLKFWVESNESLFFALLAFMIPLVVRTIPEILMGPFIVGFDPIAYYVPNTLAWLTNGVSFWSLMATAPLLYVLLASFTYVGASIVVVLKILAPLLLGLLGLVVYFYAKTTLQWAPKKSLIAVSFVTLYFVALRISWDMLRSELALIFLFVALIFLKKGERTFRSWIFLSLAMIAVVFAQQIVAIIMFAIVISALLHWFVDKKTGELRRLVVCSIPAVVLFCVVVYANVIIQAPLVSDYLNQDSGGFMALVGFASYSDLVVDTLGFVLFCYLPLLPLLVLGARRFKSNYQLKTWIFMVFLWLFLVFISPNSFFAVLPYRWTLLLTFPLAFYAADAFYAIKRNSFRISIALILAILSASFIALPNNSALFYYDSFPTYVPKSMLQNTVQLSDCQDTVNALGWVRNNMPNNARLLVHDVFYGWASLTINGSQLISYGFSNPETVAEDIERSGPTVPLYLIWWVNGTGWYGQPFVSSTFKIIYQSGNIAIFNFSSRS